MRHPQESLDAIAQSQHNALWKTMDVFPAFIDKELCRDYVLTLFFYKAICDSSQRYGVKLRAAVRWRALQALTQGCGVGARIDNLLKMEEGDNEAPLAGIFHGLRIAWGDTLRTPQLLEPDGTLKVFDVVLAALPFDLTGRGLDAAAIDRFGRFAMGVPPARQLSFAFVLHMLATLKPGIGRMAVLVRRGVLTAGGTEGAIRRNLIDANVIDAVIWLPARLAAVSGANVLLILRSKKVGDAIYFVDASAADANTCVSRIVAAYETRRYVTGFACLMGKAEVAVGKWHLEPRVYVAALSPLATRRKPVGSQ